MTQYRIASIAFIACILTAFAGLAHAEIARCANDAGEPTFTDALCKSDAQTVRIVGTSKAAHASLPARKTKRSFVTAERERAAKAAIKRPPMHKMAIDVAMIKVAHARMATLDEPEILAREQEWMEIEQIRSSSYWAWLVPMSAFRNTNQKMVNMLDQVSVVSPIR
jgi:hypothetical protein